MVSKCKANLTLVWRTVALLERRRSCGLIKKVLSRAIKAFGMLQVVASPEARLDWAALFYCQLAHRQSSAL